MSNLRPSPNSSDLRIRTNNVPRPILQGWDLTPAERADFDYIDWEAVENGEAMPEFFRFKGRLYDIGEFASPQGVPSFNPLAQWDGYMNDSFFSGLVIRFVPNDPDAVIVATFFA